ncbi:hypothetical protein [Paracoccus chinensis]|uniref:Uncharacterized protein n=1 Tax=Paracoccus chinensis TaxID=525640 RepID=A0A1G9JSH0_9RHOB|nr:hypothetical protein [Paracoccus chinensis]SDL40114.1 hypothetical protein SAMN04487971_11022 [Paracoccus chinensis]
MADHVLLARNDAFQAEAYPAGNLVARVDLARTLLNDSDQSLIASDGFTGSTAATDDSGAAVVAAFQAVMNNVLPQATAWVVTV